MQGTIRRVRFPLFDEVAEEQALSVDGFMAYLQQCVRRVRSSHPDLAEYHLHDVSLSMTDGRMIAEFFFRR